MSGPGVGEVRRFWESHPLWTGESREAEGSPEFFEEHRRVCVQDCFAGRLDSRCFPPGDPEGRVLDLGCGIGFWTVELSRSGVRKVTAADLTFRGLLLARRRCALSGIKADFAQQNAESLGFRDGAFSHVNCQGVIHHTPDSRAAVAEIARVLEPGGSASISVYYKNALLRGWPLYSWFGRLLAALGARLKGRGREGLYAQKDAAEIVRLYDGKDNPVGKAYTRKEFERLVSPWFRVEEVFLHFFPARSLPFRIPGFLHRFLDRHLGFMIYASLRKI